MTHEDINKKAYEKYPAKLAVVDLKGQEPRQIDLNEEARNAYIEAYKEISALPTIEGWVARDGDGLPRLIHLFTAPPKREEEKTFKGWIRSWRGPTRMMLPKSSFPEVTWESEPKKVKVTIKAE